MSSFDLPKIVESLQLKKVKQRNDALQLLRSFSVAKLRLTPRHFVVLLEGLLKLIEIERQVYGNNSTGATQERLLTASTILKDILDESLKKHQLRYKHCTSIFNNVVTCFFLPDTRSILAPCAIDFAKILRTLLQEQFFITHLSVDSWTKCYKFLLSLLTALLDIPEHSEYQFSHESLLSDLLNSLHCLIGGDSLDIYEPLKKLKIYVSLRKILGDVFELYNKRESSVLVGAFKVTNKLLVSLSSEDFIFCHKLIHTAFHPLINFAHTTVDALLSQFVILINLDCFYRYINIDDLPRLITSDPEEEENSSRKRPNPFSIDMQLDISSTYNVGVLAQALLNRLINMPQKLSRPDISFTERAKISSWFDLMSFRLESANEVLWLLFLGTSRLLTKYYEMVKNNSIADMNQSFLLGNLKRLKLQGSNINIKSFDDMDKLLSNMITYSGDSRVQICGLQLISFTKDFQPVHKTTTNSDTSHTDSEKNVTFNNEQTTIIDIHLNEDVGTNTEDYILSQILKNFNETDLTFWCLLSTFTMLRRIDFSRCHENQTLTRRLHQILKLIIPLAKVEHLSRLSCRIFSFIIFSYHPDRLYRLIDSGIRTQLLSLLDLAEISGPSSIHCDALRFWWALHWAMAKLTNSQSNGVSRASGRWMLSKWNEEFLLERKVIIPEPNRPFLLAHFILWLLGTDIKEISKLKTMSLQESYRVSKFSSFSNLHSDFEKFLALEKAESIRRIHELSILPCIENDTVLSSIFDKIEEASTHILGGNEDLDKLFHWTQFVSHVCKLFGDVDSNIRLSLDETCEKLWKSLFMNASSQDDYILIMKLLTEHNLVQLSSVARAFVFRQLEQFFFSHNSSSQVLGSFSTPDTVFEEEFLNTDSSNLLTTVQKPVLETKSRLLYFTFLVRFDSEIPLMLKVLDDSDPATVLQCLSLLRDSPLISKVSINEAVRIIRLLGEGPLSSHQMDRASNTVGVTSEILSGLLPLTMENEQSDLYKDLTDLLGFLIQCEQKLLLLIESSRKNVMELILKSSSDPNKDSTSENEALTRALTSSSNSIRASLLESVKLHLRRLNSIDKIELYRSLFDTFPHPQASVERAAAYCYFFAAVSTAASQTRIPAIFNLLECHTHDFFAPYLSSCLAKIALDCQSKSSRELFSSIRLELLRSWWINNISLESFPYELFDYADFKSFVIENYKQLTSICMAVKSQRSAAQVLALLTQFAKFKGYEIQSIIYDSLPVLIPLAYTSGGVRNEIFKLLLPHLNNLYKGYMKEKVLLIILETIKMTDMSSEEVLSELMNKSETKNLFMSHVKIDSSMKVTVTPVSSNDLIRALISKFWSPEKDEFWTNKVCYFLLRQLGKDVFNDDPEVKLVAVRKIKLVLSQAEKIIEDPHIISLIIDISTCLVGSSAANDAATLISLMNFQTFRSMGQLQAFYNVGKLLNRLLDEPANVEIFKLFISKLGHVCRNDTALFGKFTFLIESSTIVLLGGTIEAAVEQTEAILEYLTEVTSTDEIAKVTIHMLMILYQDIKFPNPTHSTDNVVRLFLNFDFLQASSNKFVVWVAQYFSFHYLKSETKGDISSLIEKPEFENTNTEAFLTECSSMDFFIGQILEILRGEDYEAKSFAECILSALVWKYELRKLDSEKFLNFQKAYEELSDYIIPIDFHSCILVVSEQNRLPIGNASLAQVIESLESRVSGEKFEQWSSELMLSFFQEIARYTSIASLFASCVIRFPHLAATSIPPLVCYYILLMGLKAIPIVLDLIKALSNCDTLLETAGLELLGHIIVSIRIGSKLEGSAYQKLYSQLDSERLYSVLKDSKDSKTALMIFEDATIENNKEVNWIKWRSSIGKIYEDIDDLDMLYGIPEDSSLSNAIELLKRTGPSSDNLRNNFALLDVAAARKDLNDYGATTDALLADGLMGLAKIVSTSSKDETGGHEWGWKLNAWEIPLSENPSSDHEILYNYLKRLHTLLSTSDSLFSGIAEAFSQKKKVLDRNISLRLFYELYQQWFVTLSCLTEVQDILVCPEDQIMSKIISFGHDSSWFEEAELRFLENILLCRREAFKMRSSNSKFDNSILLEPNLTQSTCFQGLIHEILTYNAVARLNRHSQKMLNSAVLMDDLLKSSQVSDSENWERLHKFITFSIAQTLWAQGNSTGPIAMLKSLRDMEETSFSKPELLKLDSRMITSQLVLWLADSREDLGHNILSQYVEPMEGSLMEIKDTIQKSKSFLLLAKFCEKQFKASSLKSQIDNLNLRIKTKRDEIEVIKVHYGKTAVTPAERKSVQKYYNRLKGQVAADFIELESLEDTRMTFASKSTTFYLNALLVSDDEIENVDRFVSLFLELSSYEPLQKSLKRDLRSLPSYKVLSWSTQLMARLSDDLRDFQYSIQELILKLCFEHPFHTLYMLISLLYHKEIAQDTANNTMLLRVTAAGNIKERLINKDAKFASEILLPIERLCEESISLAKFKSSKGRALYLDKLEMGTYWLHHLPNIPPPILNLPISRNGYDDVPRMVSMDTKVNIATSGLSLPKIAQFTLSDGSRRKMLLKFGTDDLRQDATMEQVFEKVNSILQRDRETRKRKLRIKTYKAVPLGPKAGVIEFVPNSKALIEVIRPYHQKRDQMKYEKAKESMKECQSSTMKERVRTYETITKKIDPVLHLYFSDHFVTPDNWYDSRQRYTRGIASSSMVGHILGLGDRHCNNILLEESTGEPVHIDLGVAFDQGKRLPIPETVPFRLTRDIVDGFGFTGVHGVFDKLCEHTFRVLREHKEHIMAILDALRWDPLYLWSMSPLRKKRLQDDTKVLVPEPQDDGSEANAAVLTVLEKLDAGGLSVEATVRQLIKEATSPQNLALIYCGWCPFF